MATLFEDVSIFQGFKQFATPEGAIRAEDKGAGVYYIYVDEGDAFVMRGIIHLRKRNPSCADFWNAWLRERDN